MPRSRRIPHLEYRKSGYVWRRRLPRSLQRLSLRSFRAPTFQSIRTKQDKSSEIPYLHLSRNDVAPDSEPEICGNPLLVFSLKTHSFPAAQELARRLTSYSNLAFHYAAIDMTLTTTEVSQILTTLVRFDIAATDQARALEDLRTPEIAEQALQRERSIQDVLRRALLLRDREVARQPLRRVATHLGIQLPESGEDWKLLAYEATRVLLDLSEERERRERGLFSGPSSYFAQGIAQQAADTTSCSLDADTLGGVALATAQSTAQKPHMNLSPRAPWQCAPAFFPATPSEQPALKPMQEPVSKPVVAVEKTTPATAPNQQTKSEENGPLAIAATRILLKKCHPKTIAALKKGQNIRIEEGFDVYFDLKLQGYGEDWEKQQKPNACAGKRWKETTLPGLRVGKKIWVDLQRNKRFRDVREDDVVDCITVIQSIPKLHGKSSALSAKRGFRDLVERVPFIEQKQMNDAELALKRKGESDQTAIEAARLKEAIPPLRAETFFKHVRAVNRVAKMLIGLGVIQENPFANCSFTNAEEKSYKAGEAKMARQSWDDRAKDLFATPMFQGETRDEGDPLFWSPLLGFLQGLRGEEGLQLGPDDFGKKNGIDYMRIHNGAGNSVKSEAGERVLPLHPALVELGLLDLVELRRKQGKRRLFSNLRRGKTKKTYTELFTKEFTRYRQAQDVYWHGLDLHATRTTFHHELMDLSTPGYIRRKLMGHEPLDEGERSYAQNGISLATLHEHVSRIRFNAAAIQSPIRKCAKSGTLKRAQELGLRAI
ncbi:hypothetical protein [Aliiroseovarius sp. S253]|uniref:hypothetical protein n=1 Tax=Aliiroseovarius sp. S253 TaxID=3415133 RepID=UPI003C7DB13B